MSEQIKIFTDMADQVILMTKTQRLLESKLIMLGFQETNALFNKYSARDYKLNEHFVRINLNNNTYDQGYNEVNTSTRSGITEHAITEIIQRMEEYDSRESD